MEKDESKSNIAYEVAVVVLAVLIIIGVMAIVLS